MYISTASQYNNKNNNDYYGKSFTTMTTITTQKIKTWDKNSKYEGRIGRTEA